VRLTQTPPDVVTMLFGFASVADGAGTVSAIIAAGMIPAALEMMDRNAIRVVEDFVPAGLPLDAEAVLLVEIDGLSAGIANDADRIRELARANNATSERTAANGEDRALLWKGRKNAFGAVARLAPDYYLHDTVVPRKSLVEVLEKVNAVAEKYELTIVNVFHAGDGNLHPILAFDGSDSEVNERVHRAAVEIVQISLDAGGSLSGEHGIGLEKRDYMTLMFTSADLAAQELVRSTFDPEMRSNPAKVLPGGSRCGELTSVASAVNRSSAPVGENLWV
jgi:glycolate dehydrogenase FAD-linked subunit